LKPGLQPSKFWSYGSPMLALAHHRLIGITLFRRWAKTRSKGLAMFFWEPIKTPYALGELMVKATPLAGDCAGAGGVFSL
jgi:ABC-type uncharacterized transport system permease subunit